MFLAIAGVLLAAYSVFIFDTSVETGLGGRVHNLGLLRDQNNMLLFGAAALIAGVLMAVFGKKGNDDIVETDATSARIKACIEHGTPEQLLELIESGAFDPAAYSSEVHLKQAAYAKRAPMVEILLRGGASGKTRGAGGGTLLQLMTQWHEEHMKHHKEPTSPFKPIVDLLSNPPPVDIVVRSAARGDGQAATLPVPVADELAKLASLHEKKVITDEEFSTAKKRLLGS